MRRKWATLVMMGALLSSPLRSAAQGLSLIVVNPTAVAGGTSANAQVTLTAAAPAGGFVLQASSSHPAIASVPATVNVPAGVAAVSFPITTVPTAQETSVVITVERAGDSKTAQLSVRPPCCLTLTLQPTGVTGGVPATGLLRLASPAPAGFTVKVSSNNPAVTVVSPITIKQGETNATFPVTTFPVAQTTPVILTAEMANDTRQVQIVVSSPTPALVFSPNSVVGTGSVAGSITLSGAAPAGGMTVQLVSSNPAVVLVPPSVTIPEGSSKASFNAATLSVAENTNVSVTANAGTGSATGSIQVQRASINQLSVAPAQLLGGLQTVATVTLNAVAPQGGVRVILASINPQNVQVPDSVVVPAGQTTVTAALSTVRVAQASTVTISARAGDGIRTASVHLLPPAPQSLRISTPNIVGGRTAYGVVQLNAPAPTAGLQLSLTSSAQHTAAVPTTFVMPAGLSIDSFPIATIPIGQSVTATISVGTGSTEKTASITVNPPALHAFTVSPTSVFEHQNPNGTVTLNGRVASTGTNGIAVQLTSSHVGVLTIPSSVTVPPGDSTVVFGIATLQVTQPTTVTIAARLGAISRTVTVTVRPASGHASLGPRTAVGRER